MDFAFLKRSVGIASYNSLFGAGKDAGGDEGSEESEIECGGLHF